MADIDAVLDVLELLLHGSDLGDQLILKPASRVQPLPVLTVEARCSAVDGVEILRA